MQNGYALLLQYFVSTVAVLIIARLALVALTAILDRVFRISPDFIRRYPGLEARANRYFPALRSTLSGIVTAITIIALLEVWGIGVTTWFSSSPVGRRLLSAVATIGVAAAVALAVWEASNAGMERHLARLARENRFARAARLRTFLPMLRTALLTVIVAVVALTALSELGVNIAPLLAGAGIIGIAIGFGSQKLVQDLITGLFLLLENAVQVGDAVTVSGLSGVVENLSIRTIRLRAGDGSVHIIPFSSVTSVTNTNRGIGNAAISVNVAYKEDTRSRRRSAEGHRRADAGRSALQRHDPRRPRPVGRGQARRQHGDPRRPDPMHRLRPLAGAARILPADEEAVR